MKLIVGLGNPGKKYEKTRHNVGFVILDALHTHLRIHGANDWSLSKKFNAEISGVTVAGKKVVLAKPMTYMNASGQSVQLIGHFYKLTHRDIIVVHDDKDLPLGTYKIESDRGDAGHNGIKSLIKHIGTKDILRVRVGVASENKKKMTKTDRFVLGKFSIFEKRTLNNTIDRVVGEIDTLLHGKKE